MAALARSALTLYSGGAGGATGAILATAKPLWVTAKVIYLHHTGDDAYSGMDRVEPVKTLNRAMSIAGALTQAAIIDVLPGHRETITAGISLGGVPGLWLVGEGTGIQRPYFTNGGVFGILVIEADDVVLDNLVFTESLVDTLEPKIAVGDIENFTIQNCVFRCGACDRDSALQYGGLGGYEYTSAGRNMLLNTQFVNTSVSAAAQAGSAIKIAGPIGPLTMDNVVLDGGVYGWGGTYAFLGDSKISLLRATNIDLLNDSDMILTSDTYGFVNIRNQTGSARIEWG